MGKVVTGTYYLVLDKSQKIEFNYLDIPQSYDSDNFKVQPILREIKLLQKNIN